MVTTLAAIDAAAAALRGAEDGRRDAEILLAHVTGWPRSRLLAYPEDVVEPAAAARFEALVTARAGGVPVAYLLGQREFWTLALRVTPDVLVPRPETELLVERTLAAVRTLPAPKVLDLGTGSGAIGLALAAERPDLFAWLTDASPAAADVARANAARLGLANVRVVVGHWYDAVPAEVLFDAVVSNPPYLAESDPHLGSGSLPHEPRTALVSGAGGLESLVCVVGGAPARLRPGGLLVVEHGHLQGAAVRDLFTAAGFLAITTYPDLAGHERATEGRRPG